MTQFLRTFAVVFVLFLAGLAGLVGSLFGGLWLGRTLLGGDLGALIGCGVCTTAFVSAALALAFTAPIDRDRPTPKGSSA